MSEHLLSLAFLGKPDRLSAFRAFLSERGCDVLEPTNDYEVIRFRAGAETNVVYRQKTGKLTVVGFAFPDAARAFLTSQAWRPTPKTPSLTGSQRRNRFVPSLLKRDGECCWYCGEPLGDDVTIEHFVPTSQRGPNVLANMALTHDACNKQAGHLPVVEKVKLRDAMRARPPRPTASRPDGDVM